MKNERLATPEVQADDEVTIEMIDGIPHFEHIHEDGTSEMIAIHSKKEQATDSFVGILPLAQATRSELKPAKFKIKSKIEVEIEGEGDPAAYMPSIGSSQPAENRVTSFAALEEPKVLRYIKPVDDPFAPPAGPAEPALNKDDAPTEEYDIPQRTPKKPLPVTPEESSQPEGRVRTKPYWAIIGGAALIASLVGGITLVSIDEKAKEAAAACTVHGALNIKAVGSCEFNHFIGFKILSETQK